MTTLAYWRFSTVGQNPELERQSIHDFAAQRGLTPFSWLEEEVSIRCNWRTRTLAQLLSLQAGDNLIVYDWSHLASSLRECAEILSQALNQQVNIYALQQNCHLNDPTQFETILYALSIIRHVDFELRSEATKVALAAKRDAGFQLGRPRGNGVSKLDAYRFEIELLLANGSTQKFIAQRYGTTPANLSKWMKQHGLKRHNK